jgi:hypothetical protein
VIRYVYTNVHKRGHTHRYTHADRVIERGCIAHTHVHTHAERRREREGEGEEGGFA